MNETQKAILGRYSCRDFTGEPLTQAQLDALVEAALSAPSAMNSQPWKIIMVTDKALIEKMDAAGMAALQRDDQTAYQRMMDRGGRLLYNAPCMVLVLGNNAMDNGILTQNVALSAHAMGLGNVICGLAGVPLNGAQKDEFRKALNWPEGYNFGMAVLVGNAKSDNAPHALDFGKVSWVK